MTAGNARWLHAADALFMTGCALVFACRAVTVLMVEGSSGWVVLAYAALAALAVVFSVIHLSLVVDE